MEKKDKPPLAGLALPGMGRGGSGIVLSFLSLNSEENQSGERTVTAGCPRMQGGRQPSARAPPMEPSLWSAKRPRGAILPEPLPGTGPGEMSESHILYLTPGA